MSRPKPTVLMTHVNTSTYKAEEVLEADAIYAVFYKGRPINMRSMSSLIDYPGPKYKKTAFANAGHAFNLAERLNKIFKTQLFEVYRLVEGQKVTETDD